jgi:hypothetical protein
MKFNVGDKVRIVEPEPKEIPKTGPVGFARYYPQVWGKTGVVVDILNPTDNDPLGFFIVEYDGGPVRLNPRELSTKDMYRPFDLELVDSGEGV